MIKAHVSGHMKSNMWEKGQVGPHGAFVPIEKGSSYHRYFTSLCRKVLEGTYKLECNLHNYKGSPF